MYGVQDGERPRQDEDDEVVEVVVQQILEERPQPVAEQRVPAAHYEVEDLFATPLVEQQRPPHD